MFHALLLAALASANPASVAAGTTPPAGWVVLPVEEYRSLRAKAEPPEPPPPPPPLDATVTSVDYELRVNGTTATGEVRLAIDVFKQGWIRMAVPPGLFVRAARVDGKPTSLVDGDGAKDGSRSPAVLLSRTGRSVLALDLDVPVATATGSETLTLPASGAAVTRATLTVPRSDVELSAGGGLLVERSEAKDLSRFVAVARAGSGLTLSWRRKKDEPRAGLPTRFRASLTEIFGLGEEGAQASVAVSLVVTQGAATGVELEVPEALVVNQVVGAEVADWDAAAGKLGVRFIDPVATQTSFVVAGEARTPRDGRIAIPLLRIPAAEREEGGVAVEVTGAGEITARDARGLTAADATDLGEAVAGRDSPSLAAFRLRPGDGRSERGLVLEVVRYTPQAVLMANVEEARYQALVTEDGKTLVQALYAVRNNQRSFLKLTLPKDATLWSAAVARRAVRPGRTPDGGILLPLEKGHAGEEAPPFLVEVVYLQRGAAWVDRGSTGFRTPVLDLGISRTALALQHSPRFRVKPQPGTLREAPFVPPTSQAFAPPVAAQAGVPGGVIGGVLGGRPERPPGSKTDLNQDLLRKQQQFDQKAAEETQMLVDRFNREAGYGARVVGTLPVEIPIPAVGPQLFFVSELTAEGTAPELQLSYERAK
jgi:hypothetical protein